MMFSTIARFEMRYQLRNPVFWVATILFFLLTFGATTVESIRLGSGGNIHTNAPVAVGQVLLTMSIFFMFVTTAFVANVVVRDDETGFGSIIRSTKVGKLPYMLGRFTGAFLGAAIAFLAVPLALWLGTLMPWINPELLGPNRIGDYLFAYLVIALPNLLVSSAIFFAVACWTRSVTYSYLAVILFMFLNFAVGTMVSKWPDFSLAAYLTPFGAHAFTMAVRYLTPIEANTQALELTSLLLGNRLLWIAISAAIVGVAVWRFRFAERGASTRGAKRQIATQRKLAAVQPRIVDHLPSPTPHRAAWHQLRTRVLFEMAQVFKSPSFWVLVIVGAINLYVTLTLTGLYYGIPIWPRTFAIVEAVQAGSMLIGLLIAIYYSGEVVWRERERRINEIVDATPLPNWTFLVSKLSGVAGVLLLLGVAFTLLEAVLFQFARGLTDIEPGRWLSWFVVPSAIYLFLIAVLSVVVQAVSPNKFVGWGIMLLYLVSTMVFAGMGLDHPLINYAYAPMTYSDMNGVNYGGTVSWWLRAYWLAFATILIVIGHLMWRRGTAVTLKGQWHTLPSRLRGKPLAFFSASLAVTIGLGGFLFYNMNILNRYISSDDIQRVNALYEQRYERYIGLPQPTLTDVKLKVDIDPGRAVHVDGSYGYVNATSAPIPTLHIRAVPGMDLPFRATSVPGAKLVYDDKELHYRIYRFDRPLQPGESGTLSFKTAIEKRGLAALPSDTQNHEFDAQPVVNGTYLINYQLVPLVGMSRLGFLQGKTLRQKYGLAPDLPTPKLEDRAAQAANYAGFDRVNTDITVTTDADQTLVATGARISDTVSGGRRTARFVSPSPSYNFLMIQSARYKMKSADSRGVKLQVYYHPEHHMNVDRMLSVMDDALDYYRDNFGPYQYPYARIIERPSYGGGANSAAGTIGYSEKVGFTMDLSDPNQLDFLAYVTAHELAHQYWFHQIMPADMQGAEVLTEGLAQYSALMIMKHRYGDAQIRTFLKYELDQYLQGRRMEPGEENPLARTRGQGYIHYNKSSIVMYLLQDRLGEDRVNAMLRGLLDRYRFKGAPYARSVDLVDGFLSLARTPAERQLVLDQFYRITLYDLRARDATVRRLENGQFETTFTLGAGKVYADGEGNERSAPFDELVDVGLFTARPGEGRFGSADVVLMKRFRVASGEQQVRIITKTKPAYAGVDPYISFIDRNANDNIIAVSEIAGALP